MKRLLVGAAVGMLALMTLAGPVGARTFGAVYANDAVYRVFGNAANVPDGTGTDPFAKFTNSTNADHREPLPSCRPMATGVSQAPSPGLRASDRE